MPRMRFCALILSTIFASLLPVGFTSADSLVVQTCGTLPLAYQAGATRLDTVDVNGNKCTNAGSAGANQNVNINQILGAAPSASNTLPVSVFVGGAAPGVTNPFDVGIVDGTNGPATVKAPSVAASAVDKSLVIQLNPDSPGIIALGQSTKANSVPVAIASDQLGAAAKASSLPVTFATDQYVDPCMNPLIAKVSTPVNITTATTTLEVPISGSTAIYVCALSFTISEVVTTPNTLQFEYGTGTNCTGTNKLTGLFGGGGVTAGDPILVHAGFGGTLFTAPASNGLCALTAVGASGSFQGFISYVQQ